MLFGEGIMRNLTLNEIDAVSGGMEEMIIKRKKRSGDSLSGRGGRYGSFGTGRLSIGGGGYSSFGGGSHQCTPPAGHQMTGDMNNQSNDMDINDLDWIRGFGVLGSSVEAIIDRTRQNWAQSLR